MRKWLTIGGLVMLCAWVPFFYDELTSSPTEKKGRTLPADDPGMETVGEAASAGGAKAMPAAPSEATPEPPAQPEPQKDPPPSVKAASSPSAPSDVKAEQPAAGPPETEPSSDDDEPAEPPAPPPAAAGPTAVLKRAFETQPRDPLWAADTEAHVRALFRSGDMPAELLQSASCRKAVCRLELRWTHERATAYVSLYETMHKDFGGEVGVEPLGAPDDKGQEQVNLYLARKGYTVADLAK